MLYRSTTNTDLTLKLTVTDNDGIIDDKEAVSTEVDTVQITYKTLVQILVLLDTGRSTLQRPRLY
jgi:hypothetical protein